MEFFESTPDLQRPDRRSAGLAGKLALLVVPLIASCGVGLETAKTLHGTAGILDTSFNGTGYLTLDGGSFPSPSAVVLQDGGRIVIAGSTDSASDGSDIALWFINADGVIQSVGGGPDGAFTWDGPGANDDFANGAVVLPDGSIVVAGETDTDTTSTSDYEAVLLRVKPDGSGLVNSFGSSGSRIFLGTDSAKAITGLGDGFFAFAMYQSVGYEIIRLDSDGDSDIGGGATVLSVSYMVNALATAPGGKVVGTGHHSATSLDFLAFRVCSAFGSLDNSAPGCSSTSPFNGTTGLVTHAQATGDSDFDNEGIALAVQTDGKIVATGYSQADSTPDTTDMVVWRYNSDGTLDTGFASGGVFALYGALAEQQSMGTGVHILGDGRIVVAGQVLNPETQQNDLAVWRLNPDGSPDDTFNKGHSFFMHGSGGDDFVMASALGADGKLVVVAWSLAGTEANITVWRLNVAD